MATQVRETAAGKSVSAYIVMNKNGEHVATVNAHFSNGGRVSVDVWNIGDKAVSRCLFAALKSNALTQGQFDKAVAASQAKRDWASIVGHEEYAALDLFGMQQSSAGGYGYDKLTAALAGLWIDGEQLADHCGSVANAQKAKDALLRQYCKFHDHPGDAARAAEKGWDRAYWDKKAKKIGAHFANWSTEKNRYTSLHFGSGLDRLQTLGYTVIQAL